MFTYYKRSLLSLFSLVKTLRANPHGESETCLAIQEKLLKNITYIEQNIRECHASIRNLNRRLRTQQPTRLTKAEAQAIKNGISYFRHRIDEYQQLLTIFREIGDALAFTYIDKYDIKPLAMKEAPGFLSQKAGLRRELKALRTVFSLGRIGIMNDLTNCLRYGDISVIKDGKVHIIEVKSGKYLNSRAQRQSAEARKVVNYLTKGDTDGLYEINGKFQRIGLHSPEVHHRDQLNALISSAMKNETSYAEVEHGLHYLVLTKFHADVFDLLSNKCKGKPIVSIVNETKYDRTGYYPFSLSIYDSEAWYAFHCDKLVICVLVDSAVIENEFKVHGLGMELQPDKDWVMAITNSRPSEGETEHRQVSRHFFGRLFVEFLSLGWFMQELIHGLTPGPTLVHRGE